MSNELSHHGVKGMKWGVRRTDAQLGNSTGGQRNNSLGSKEAKTLAKQANVAKAAINNTNKVNSNKATNKARMEARREASEQLKNMSDKELRERVNRLNMEQQYMQLVENRASRDIGKSRVDQMLELGAGALKVTATAFSIYSAIQEIRGA